MRMKSNNTTCMLVCALLAANNIRTCVSCNKTASSRWPQFIHVVVHLKRQRRSLGCLRGVSRRKSPTSPAGLDHAIQYRYMLNLASTISRQRSIGMGSEPWSLCPDSLEGSHGRRECQNRPHPHLHVAHGLRPLTGARLRSFGVPACESSKSVHWSATLWRRPLYGRHGSVLGPRVAPLLVPGCWTLDLGRWTLDVGSWILGFPLICQATPPPPSRSP